MHSAAKPQPKELNKLHGLHELHRVEEFAQAAQTLMDSSTNYTKTQRRGPIPLLYAPLPISDHNQAGPCPTPAA